MENTSYRTVLLVVVVILLIYILFFSKDGNERFEHAENVGKECKTECKKECDKKCKECEKKCKKMKGKAKTSCMKKCKSGACSKKKTSQCLKKCDTKCKSKAKKEKKVEKETTDTEVETDTDTGSKVSETADVITREEIDEMIKQAIDKKSNVWEEMNNEKSNFDKLTSDETYLSNIKFSRNWTQYPDDKTDASEISNDTTNYKQLMIVGNKSAGGVRQVGVWDKLNVNGKLQVNGQMCVGNTCLSEADLQRMIK